MLHFLLDTNVFAEPMRPAPNPLVLERLRRHQQEIAIATVVWHEMLFGCFRLPQSARRGALEKYLNEVVALLPMFSYDENAAEWHARERARLMGLGRTPVFVDGQIAAIAHVNELILVTANTSDYHDFSGLHVVDWTR